jgi:hypothetical protein
MPREHRLGEAFPSLVNPWGGLKKWYGIYPNKRRRKGGHLPNISLKLVIVGVVFKDPDSWSGDVRIRQRPDERYQFSTCRLVRCTY